MSDERTAIGSPRHDGDVLELATFQVGGLVLAIDIRRIADINDNIQIFPVPGVPPAVRGVINLRGDVVTVADPRFVLHGEPCVITAESRNIIVESENESIALLVDRVMDVMSTQISEIEPSPANLGGTDGAYFSGVIRLESMLVIVLNVEAVMSAVTASVQTIGA